MKIIIERKWKKGDYTIGRLYIEGKQVCNTLEPTDCGLVNEAKAGALASEEWIKADAEAKGKKAVRKTGTTAIPTGYYKVTTYVSSKFHAKRAFLRDVPGFEGIMIHEGNRVRDTKGCILVGYNTIRGGLTDSKKALAIVNKAIQDAEARGELVVVQIKPLLPAPSPLGEGE